MKKIDFHEAKKQVDQAVENKKKSIQEQKAATEKHVWEYRTSLTMPPPDEKYRDNYEAVFGHK